MPLYFGVHGPRSLRLSGELADGTLLGWFSSPDYVRWARERIDEGRARAGRTDDHAVVALLRSCPSPTTIPTRHERSCAAWAVRVPRGAGRVAGDCWPPTRDSVLDAALKARDDEARSDLPDELLDEFMAAGTSADCRRYVERLLDAGADRVVLVPNPAGQRSTRGMLEQIRRGGEPARHLTSRGRPTLARARRS